MAIYGRLWQIMAIQKAIAIPIYSYNQTVIEQYGNMTILERKNNYNTAYRKTLILFNIPSVTKTKKVRHCLMTHPSYYNLVYSLAGNSLLILSSFIISPQNN